MKILITGCAGFIGSHTTEFFLNKNFQVVGIDNFDDFYPKKDKEKNLSNFLQHKNFQFVEMDICKPSDFAKLPKDIDCVIHLAAKAGVRPSIENPSAYIENNINGTFRMLEFMKMNRIKNLVFASSSSVYGNNPKIPFSETDSVDKPISPYAFTKKSCEMMNHTYHHLYQFNIVNLRLFTVFGPRQRPDLAIRKFVEMIKKDEPVTMFGNGETARDYTFVEDIVSGIFGAFEFLQKNKNVFEIVNLGNHSPVKLMDLIHTIYAVLKKEPKIKILPMQQGDVEMTYADISKAKELFNYQPKTSLRKGVEKFIKWHEQQQ